MLFISRVIIVMFFLASGANATTLAIPMDDFEVDSFQTQGFETNSFQNLSLIHI